MSGNQIPGWESDHSQFHARRRACLTARTRTQNRLAALLVEHDNEVARQLVEAFVGQPVEVLRCADAATALLQVGRTCPDAVILGPVTDPLGATDFLSIVRAEDQDLPIIVGAGAGSGDLAAVATELGATVVIRRPYPARELLGLLRSLAPRPEQVELRPLVLDLGRLRVDGTAPQFWLDGQAVSLPPMEFLILRYLAERVGAVVTRKELLRAVWGKSANARSNTLSVHIMRLRKRLGDDEHNPRWIKVLRGLGYQFAVPEIAVPPQATPGERSPDVHTG